MQGEYGSPPGAPEPNGGRAAARRFNPWVVMLVLSTGMFMTLLDLTIVNIAIPRIVDGVHASLDEVLWMLNAYSLGYAVLLITSGRLGDIVGPRRLFVGGIALFTAASALSGLAPTAGVLIAGRALQGVGAALLAPQSMAILVSIFPPERRGPVFGVFGMLSGLAVVAGPTLGGLLVTDLSWRWIFFVNLPIGVGVLLAASRLVPDLRPGRRHRLDLAGMALVTAAIFCIVYGLIEGQRYDWGTITGPLSIPLLIAAGVVLLGAFLIHQARRQGGEPLLTFALFRDRNFTLMALVLAAMSFFILGIYLPLTIYYPSVLGLSALAAGLVVAVQPGAMFLSTGPANGPATTRLGANRVLTAGLLLFAAGAAYIAWDVQADSSRWSVVPGLVVGGLGMGCIWGHAFQLATRDLRVELAGVASGTLSTLQEMGAVIASASVGALLQNRLATSLHAQAVAAASHLPAHVAGSFVASFTGAAASGLQIGAGQSGAALRIPAGTPPSLATSLESLAHSVFAEGFVAAMKPTMLLPVGVLGLAAVASLFARGRSRGDRAELTEAEADAAGTSATQPLIRQGEPV
ncbi:MAG: DHA2 family efflux MFS transporter permease subunit [Candidatus Dormibacteria bacterium]|nr:MFS transporter [Chloroflexota bacterium]HBV93275.1 MFS transporter [Chloroflexota bacterium]